MNTEKSTYFEVTWCSVNTGEHCELFYDCTKAIEWFHAMRHRGDNTRVIYRSKERTDYTQTVDTGLVFFTEHTTRETVYINENLIKKLYEGKKNQER